MFCKLDSTAVKVAGKGRKPLARVGGNAVVIRGSDTGHKERLVGIHSITDWVNNFEHSTSPKISI